MNNHDDIDPRDERALQALFDETSSPPTQQQLHRMARAAAQIPEKSHARAGLLGWFGLSSWRPALAFGFVGAAALAAWLAFGRGPGTPGPAPPMAELTAPTPSADPQLDPGTEDGEPIDLEKIELATEDEPDWVEEDALAVLDDDDVAGGPLAALDLLAGADEESEMDIWATASGALFGDTGEDAELDEDEGGHDG
jgi:hypothetical protein